MVWCPAPVLPSAWVRHGGRPVAGLQGPRRGIGRFLPISSVFDLMTLQGDPTASGSVIELQNLPPPSFEGAIAGLSASRRRCPVSTPVHCHRNRANPRWRQRSGRPRSVVRRQRLASALLAGRGCVKSARTTNDAVGRPVQPFPVGVGTPARSGVEECELRPTGTGPTRPQACLVDRTKVSMIESVKPTPSHPRGRCGRRVVP